MTLPTYSFLPWIRRGIANTITTADGDHSVATRATTHVELQLAGDPVSVGAELTQAITNDIALYGPGDVIGIDQRAVIRTDPRNWITNFEGNYLPAIDFYDEDFPWRYTPAAPDPTGLHLRPWITLLVLAEGEFDDGKDLSGRPLAYITLHDANLLPPAGDLWAWAHVHFNQTVADGPDEIVSTDTASVVTQVETIIDANRDDAYSRLLSPRRLTDQTTYHAFVIPTFESGRLAGLGLDPTKAPFATESAWAAYTNRPQDLEHPIYYRWQFTTGTVGDFEYLVRLLKPEPIDPRVGIRDMDVQNPGSNLPGTAAALGGILRLGGALQVPETDLDPAQLVERTSFENWDQPYPNPFEQDLAAFVNLADDYAAQTPKAANSSSGLASAIGTDEDPLITAPLYGRWHALTQRLLTERDDTAVPNPDNWVHRLNLDPRFRVPAGFGANVVEANAEEYMNDAWQQIGSVLAANAVIRRLQLASAVASRWFDQHLVPLAAAAPERALAITAPVANRVVHAGKTVESARAASLMPMPLTSTAMRRILRPGARFIRNLPFTATVTPRNLLQRINAGEVLLVAPKVVPPGVVTVNQAAATVGPSGGSSSLLGRLAKLAWLPWVLIALALVLLILFALLLPTGVGIAIGVVVFLALVALAIRLLLYHQEEATEATILEQDQTPAEVATLPKNPTFALTDPESSTSTPTGATDSVVAVRFKQALSDSFALLQASTTVGRSPVLVAVDLPSLVSVMVTAVDPTVTMPRRVFSGIQIPDWILTNRVDPFGEVMAYPKIDLPMYQPLKEISVELFLPNINLIAPNSITLIETNQRFIEAYMVGLNYEFGRKLLWREYPTDMRGSYFRQFWDVKSVIDTDGLSESAFTEQHYDIPEIHRWPLDSALGTHNNREPVGTTAEEAVLVIRGELLKKYPTAIIYAHRAKWTKFEADGTTPDLTVPRELVDLTDAEQDKPPTTKVRFPLYEAKADPDIYFFGFDLTIDEAKGGTGVPPSIDPGWFFVIKERPGEPHFGLELSQDGTPQVFDEITWDDAIGAEVPAGPPQFLPALALSAVTLAPPAIDDPEGKTPQRTDDLLADTAMPSAARWAYVLFRPPVMVAIHADQMLRNP